MLEFDQIKRAFREALDEHAAQQANELLDADVAAPERSLHEMADEVGEINDKLDEILQLMRQQAEQA